MQSNLLTEFREQVNFMVKERIKDTLRWDYEEYDKGKICEVEDVIFHKLSLPLSRVSSAEEAHKILETIDQHIANYMYRSITEEAIKNLASATLLQAAKDYCRADTKVDKRVILKELNSDWMDLITDGESFIVAEQLPMNERAIRKRLKVSGELN